MARLGAVAPLPLGMKTRDGEHVILEKEHTLISDDILQIDTDELLLVLKNDEY